MLSSPTPAHLKGTQVCGQMIPYQRVIFIQSTLLSNDTTKNTVAM